MNEKLKDCPFCGGKAEISKGAIYCPVCEISFSNERETGAKAIKEVEELWNARPIETDAVDFWNYRSKEEQLGEKIREMKQKNDALKREILEAREDNCENMEYHVAERKRLKKEIEELENSVAFAERIRVLDLLKTCCNEFVKSRFKPCRRVKTVDAKGRCTARATCPIYAELTKGEKV